MGRTSLLEHLFPQTPAQGRPELWTPDRNIPIDRQRNVDYISPREMKLFEDLHALATRIKVEIRCPKCGESFQGQNDGHARTQAIFCGCREIRADVGGRVVQP
jgi:hypothetical protein